MKKFQFSLESVMGYQNQLLSAAQAEVARINSEIAQVEEEERLHREEYRLTEQNMQEHIQRGIVPQMIAYYRNYLENIRKLQRASERKKHALNRELERSIHKMTKINVDVKSLEKLKEKELRLYQAESAKEQERIVEEFAVFMRKSV